MIGRSEDQMIAVEEDIAFLTAAAGRPQIGTIHLGPHAPLSASAFHFLII
jgi:hypothetical protein